MQFFLERSRVAPLYLSVELRALHGRYGNNERGCGWRNNSLDMIPCRLEPVNPHKRKLHDRVVSAAAICRRTMRDGKLNHRCSETHLRLRRARSGVDGE